ncbi:MAG: RAMP superfamily CRISPR-associated protein [Candidatus Bipolaricaulia bacterium]
MTIQWLVCREPVHIGGADSSSRGNNNPIYRLSDRTPAIPGSSLRGALREHAEEELNDNLVVNWFGGKDEEISPGSISLGWGWPVWWPVNVLGYGNWWISCPSWLNRFQTLSNQNPLNFPNKEQVYITEQELDQRTVYLRWLKLTQVQYYENPLPAPADVPEDRRIIVPDESINLFVDMGLVRQPRVSLRDEPDENGNLVNNLFGVEGFPPGAVFLMNWTTRGNVQNTQDWEDFLQGEHYLGGLWSVGYGRIAISPIGE